MLFVLAGRSRRIRGLTAFGSPEECECRPVRQGKVVGDVVGNVAVTMSDGLEPDEPQSRSLASRRRRRFTGDGLVADSNTVAPDSHFKKAIALLSQALLVVSDANSCYVIRDVSQATASWDSPC